MRSWRALCLLVVAIAALPSCVGVRAPAPAPHAAPLPETALPPDVASLLLTIFPTPREAAYGDVLLPLAGHRRVDVGSPQFLDVLESRDLLEAWSELPPEGYVLEVSWEHDRTLVVIGAADEAGQRWAEEALRQITLVRDGRAWARDCIVVDQPGFPFRGNKRPQAWEAPYRANFAWGAQDSAASAGRERVAFFAPGSPFDATAEGLDRALAEFGPLHQGGVRRFAIKFDDVGFGLTPASRLAFGSYPRALVSYLRRLRTVLRSVDPEVVVYYLPQTYWWNDERLPGLSRAVRLSGGLDGDVGLVLTGPEIISATIDAPGLAAARRAFGATQTKALIYDNLGREGDWGPLTGRDPALIDECDGVFGERGTPVHRLTRLDWSWNPGGYSAERSWRRALLELAGPQGFEALREACAAFRASLPVTDVRAAIDGFEAAPGREWPGPLPRSELLRVLRDDLRRLEREQTRAASAAPGLPGLPDAP